MIQDHIVSIPRNAREELRIVRHGDSIDLRVFRQDGLRQLKSTEKGFRLKAEAIGPFIDALIRASRAIDGGAS